MNRYGRTGLRVLGGLLALVLAATLLPAAVYAAGGAYQVDEDSVYMNMEDSRPAALAAQVSRAPADNVTMQLFNYTGAINGQGPLEFYHSWGASVDGDASGSGARPSMSPTLEDNKWPYVTGIPGSKASGSLGYLFSDSAVPGKTVYSVGRGGSTGLFQRDSKGYLYYDSLRNAASYDAASGRFQLYDGIVRPWYTGYVEPDGKTVFDDRTIAFNGNFLPFNDLTGATEAPRGRSPAAYRLPDGKVDLWFGMSMSFDFYMPADGKINGEDMIFQFLGDDDVFVYIDGVLVLDIGGTHGANSGSINFATGDVTHPREGVSGAAEADDYVTTTLAKKFQTAGMTGSFDGSTFGDYTKHTLHFFYLERGGNVSYCYLRFNTPTLPNNSLTVAKELSGGEQELNRYLAGAMDYRFRVLRPDGSLYVPEGTAYQLLENSTAVGSGAVGAGGYFTLKAGQMAQFTDMLTLGGGSYDYLVEETMPDRLTGQYRQVQYTVGSGTGTTVSPTAEEDFTGFRTDTLTAAATQLVTYRNVVNTSALGELRVTKQVAEGSDAAAGRAFDIGVALGGEAVPAGTPYTVNGEERTVETAGIVPLAHGETAVFTGLLAGTAYAVTETPPEGWRAAFDAAVTAEGVASPTSADGEVPVGGSVAVTVTNATYDYAISLPLTKTLLGEAEADGFWCGGEIYRVAVLPNGVDDAVRITVNGSVWDGGALAFVNRTSRSLTVRKTVEGEMGDRSKAFPFTAVLTVDGQAVPFPVGEGYTVSGGQAAFALRHGESLTFTGLPYGGVVTVTETEHAGYTVTNTGRSGDSGAVTLGDGGELVFVNTKRAVPDLGVAGGTLLPAGALVCCGGGLLLWSRKRRA